MILKYPIFWLFIILPMISGSVAAQATDPVVADSNAAVLPATVSIMPDAEADRKSGGISDEQRPITTDSVSVKPHSPRRATLYSMVLPGLGQIYNKKYWKVPVIYAGIGALAYMGIQNNREYKRWHEAYIYTINNETTPTDNDLVGKYDATQLKSQSNYYLRNIELTYILGSFLYILNMVDAAVDAHLFNYDISDDLSLRVMPEPILQPGTPAPLPSGLAPALAFSLTWQL